MMFCVNVSTKCWALQRECKQLDGSRQVSQWHLLVLLFKTELANGEVGSTSEYILIGTAIFCLTGNNGWKVQRVGWLMSRVLLNSMYCCDQTLAFIVHKHKDKHSCIQHELIVIQHCVLLIVTQAFKHSWCISCLWFMGSCTKKKTMQSKHRSRQITITITVELHTTTQIRINSINK